MWSFAAPEPTEEDLRQAELDLMGPTSRLKGEVQQKLAEALGGFVDQPLTENLRLAVEKVAREKLGAVGLKVTVVADEATHTFKLVLG
jgi:hypothetical protein